MSNIICPDCGGENIRDNDSCEKCSANLKLNDKYYLTKILGENIGITYLGEKITNNLENLPKDEFLKNTVKLQLNNLGKDESEVVVIKELSLRTIDKWKNADLFKREGEILSQLNHESIPKLIEEFEIGIGRNSKSYIVMEYINGVSLRKEFKNRRYTEEEVINIALEVGEILDYLHSLRPPIIHRDIKLSNIMRREDGKLLLIDFGSVKNIVNNNATVSGTYGFMAPEQFTGKASQASDFYALGVVLLVLLTRKEPEDMSNDDMGLNWKEYIYASNKLIFLLERLLDKDPKKRINSLQAIKNILDSRNTIETLNKNNHEPIKIGLPDKKNSNNLTNTNIYKDEFKRIDKHFSSISAEDNYKAWKGNLDAVLGFAMFGVAGGAWYFYNWYYGLAAGISFVIIFMLVTGSWYKRKAKRFLNMFINKINNTDNLSFTIAMLNVWAQKHDLGDEFFEELKKYEAMQAGNNNIDIQEINEYKTQIKSDTEFMSFSVTYMKELYPGS